MCGKMLCPDVPKFTREAYTYIAWHLKCFFFTKLHVQVANISLNDLSLNVHVLIQPSLSLSLLPQLIQKASVCLREGPGPLASRTGTEAARPGSTVAKRESFVSLVPLSLLSSSMDNYLRSYRYSGCNIHDLINEPLLPWLQTDIYHMSLDVKNEGHPVCMHEHEQGCSEQPNVFCFLISWYPIMERPLYL